MFTWFATRIYYRISPELVSGEPKISPELVSVEPKKDDAPGDGSPVRFVG